MSTLEPNNNDDHDKNPFDKDYEEILSKLSLMKQFSLRTSLNSVENMSKEQAISTVKLLIVSKAYLEETYAKSLRMGMGIDVDNFLKNLD